ncbi:hypothetical protein VTJ49DRAFT_1002 [Mycothermus thermophilus]|uniref:O-methyltransferase domain-containing protein n=1 Tax=Humicola insolens TaxID=85995 RepID=A0ABR3VDV8_HUMIN
MAAQVESTTNHGGGAHLNHLSHTNITTLSPEPDTDINPATPRIGHGVFNTFKHLPISIMASKPPPFPTHQASQPTAPNPSSEGISPNHDQAVFQDLLQKISHLNKQVLQKTSSQMSGQTADATALAQASTDALDSAAAAVRPPGDTIMGWFATMSIVSAVRVFLHWGVFDTLPQGEGESLEYAELAQRVKADLPLVVRIANMLTSSHILHHHPSTPSSSAARLSHTPTSRLLVTGQPMSAMFHVLYSHVAGVSTVLPEYFDGYGRSEPRGPAHVPMTYLHGRPGEDFFSLLKRDEPALRSFGLAMQFASQRVPVTGVYEMERVFGAVKERGEEAKPVWVDVGGGEGHVLKRFLREYPELKAEGCVVQDLEEVVVVARERAEGDGELRGVKWVPLDFMTEAPVEGAIVYYLRHIARDYSDPVLITILSNVARAMTDPAARVLISEQLHPDVMRVPGASPPHPYAAFKDFSMLSIGGKERSLEQFAAVADKAGLRVSGVWRHDATGHGVVELVRKEGVSVDG